jgi:hypothetical protein
MGVKDNRVSRVEGVDREEWVDGVRRGEWG